ncbi:MAG: excinuclease ABC subunit UvrC, partial [Promicromonosporaceae bacterium]|nr:excinuclease ABC subunit UvrC [Promicromonosporaceae bacterium]
DDLGALNKALEKNAVVLGDGTDADIFALAGDEYEAAVQVFHVRSGRIRGQRGWVLEKTTELSDSELIEQLLGQVYSDDVVTVPKEVLVPELPPAPVQLARWLSELRGSKVDLRVPQRGDKKTLAETVHKNAEHALNLHRTKRAGDLTTRAAALQEVQVALDLESAPLRIECYDVSHTGGSYQTASMVVFEDGMPRKSEYRMFNIRGPEGEGARDDTEAMYEVIPRRFSRYLKERESSGELELATGEIDDDDGAAPAGPKRFAYPPNLVIVDGGLPQVNAAARAFADLGITDVGLCGLAKRLEELWIPGEEFPVILPRASEGLYLLQRVRDEAHRFAITAHRKRRSKGMTTSALDGIPGLGPVRAKELLRHFGSLKKLKAASAEEIATVRGMGDVTAATVFAVLHPDGAEGGTG